MLPTVLSFDRERSSGHVCTLTGVYSSRVAPGNSGQRARRFGREKCPQPFSLKRGHPHAQRGEFVITSPFIVFGGANLLGHLHQTVFAKALDHAVQVSRLKGNNPVRSIGNFASQCVPMLFLLDEREQQEILNWFEREECAGVSHATEAEGQL